MAYRIHAIDFAHIACSEAVLFKDGSPGTRREIGCFAYLLSRDDTHLLIDTGAADMDAINATVRAGGCWQRNDTLEAALERFGLSPADIGGVIVTHAHYDHISNLPSLTNARIYLHQKEAAVLFDGTHAHYAQLGDVRRFLQARQQDGFVVETTDCLSIGDDILIQHTGGHTPGSQMVFADTDMGDCLLTGDAVFLLENVERDIPIGLTADRAQSANALRICREFKGRILTGHDIRVMDYFKGGTVHV
jgi:glyoxylase-like metal-dependent hydrolase (beta-lactamase superfamily II)